jgi:tRNA 2-thiocytidine biosynthesis protein TtcA
VPSHLMDSRRHDFKNIRTTGLADPEGDKAFDGDEFMAPLRAVIGISPMSSDPGPMVD